MTGFVSQTTKSDQNFESKDIKYLCKKGCYEANITTLVS